jgi:Ribbon-helix-helix protein, copG family
VSDENYATLEAISARTGASVEELVRRAVEEFYAKPLPPAHGVSYAYPTGKRPSQAEREEMERLAEKIGAQKPWLSDMVVEDHRPR